MGYYKLQASGNLHSSSYILYNILSNISLGMLILLILYNIMSQGKNTLIKMLDSLEDQQLSSSYAIKAVLGQLLLLFDMCFFASATLDAHLNYMETRETQCKADIDRISVITWTTVGYSLRILFTVLFFLSKAINLYKFIAKKHSFPRIGAFYSPLMSTLLLSIIVYDFETCTQLSSIFTISSAKKLISGYSLIVIIISAILLIVYLISYTTKKIHKSKLKVAYQIILGVIVAAGCSIGVIANVEMMEKRRLHLFSAFDLYSFAVSVIAALVIFILRHKNRCMHDVPAASDL